MRKFLALLCLSIIIFTSMGCAEEEDLLIKQGDYNADVIALHQKLIELGLYSLRAESPWGPKSVKAVKVLQYVFGVEETGVVENQEQRDKILSLTINNEAENLATGTDESIVVAPSGENSWCLPSFYPTSESGLAQLSDVGNKYFVVSFDWISTGLDIPINAKMELDESGNHYSSVGQFHMSPGNSKGHSVIFFTPIDGMRKFGSGWIIAGIGSGDVNRKLQIELSDFKFARVQDWFVLQ